MTTLWWFRAAAGHRRELVTIVCERADVSALVYEGTELNMEVILVDPTGSGVGDIPGDLLAERPKAIQCEHVQRFGDQHAFGR